MVVSAVALTGLPVFTHEYEMVWNVASMGQKKYLYVVSVGLQEIQRPDVDGGGKKLKWILKNWVG